MSNSRPYSSCANLFRLCRKRPSTVPHDRRQSGAHMCKGAKRRAKGSNLRRRLPQRATAPCVARPVAFGRQCHLPGPPHRVQRVVGPAAQPTPPFGAAALSPRSLKLGPARCRQAARSGAPAGSLLQGAAAALPRAALPAAWRGLSNAPNSALSATHPASASWEDTPYLQPRL